MVKSYMNVAFVTNMCPHYRVKTFETFSTYAAAEGHSVDYFFFSKGDEWYWQQEHGVQAGSFIHEYLPGIRVGNIRFTPTLPLKLLQKEYDAYIKCINGKFALPVTYLAARIKRKPFILWTGIWMRLQTRAHRLFFPFTRYIYRHADAIVVYGEHVKRYLISEGVAPERIFVAPHAVDNQMYNLPVAEQEQLALRQALQIEPEQKVVLYLGRLEKIKGLPDLLKAFASLKRQAGSHTDQDAVLLLAGDGGERKRLESLAAAYGITEKVRFTGYVASEKTSHYYSISDLFVLPSITLPVGKETWGLVINEAFNQGVPVVATEAVGAAAGGLVQNGINGLVVPERDSQALAKALQQLLDDEELRGKMSKNALDTIREWHNERMIEGFRAALDFVYPSEDI